MTTIKVPSPYHSCGFYPNPEYYFIKKNVEYNEYKIHKYVYNLGIVKTPKIHSYDKKTKTMVLQKINGMSLSDYYGEDETNISEEIFDKIRNILVILCHYNVEYIGITGYNFIKDNNNDIWITGFEHSTINDINNKFLKKFIKGENSWNPEFK